MGSKSNSITASDLYDKLTHHEKLILFDVRPREMYEDWKIEATEPAKTLNIPYGELVAQGGKSDPIESIQAAIEQNLDEQIPADYEVISICAKGISSQDLTAALTRMGRSVHTLEHGMEAWSELYHAEAVVELQELSIYQISRPARGCLSYVLISDGTAVVIDPLRHIDQYIQFAEAKGAKIEMVLDTHGHADHISGGRALADKIGVSYYLHPYDGIHPIDVLPAQIEYEHLRDQQIFDVGQMQIVALHVPGHTLGNMAFRVNQNYLLTGDSIFIDSIARPDLGGQSETWAPIHYRSLRRLMELPDETLILPGHFSGPSEQNETGLYAARLGDLKWHNEGLQKALEGKEAFVSYILQSLPQFPPQYIDIKRVNAGLIHPDEPQSAELETGKNICALSKP